ncbi:endonuclease domain-containing protein [Streptomyces sp. NPDC050485]|uniref:endonuclease domain-containing protein n=1 Tax=Streptomyces sp. NPDC050485 TaxID=3365617 RepID=UPI0037B33340
MPGNDAELYGRMPAAATWAFLASHPRCAICGRPSTEIDQHHGDGWVRGALCHRCNCEVGSLEAALRICRIHNSAQ